MIIRPTFPFLFYICHEDTKLVYRYKHSEVREENICLWYSIYICFLFQIENVMYNSNLFLDIFQFSPYLLFNIGFALVKLLMFAYHYRNWTPIAIGIRYLSLLPQIPIDQNKLFVLFTWSPRNNIYLKVYIEFTDTSNMFKSFLLLRESSLTSITLWSHYV